ncbi:MAG: redox-sensitive transcriptional activator SoxR [Proteobacteria bacterium]|nr:redox-sensitive transcriptional activator SoxR [Pseudomonadota bacterium]
MSEAGLSVGVVAKRAGVAVSALHFYESKGLIQSWRNTGNQRRYNKEVLRRVSIIKAAQKMGISLAEIGEQFETLPSNRAPSQRDWERMSRHWQASLDERIAYLDRLREYLTGCIGCGCLSMKVCPLYNDQDKLAVRGPGPVILEKGTGHSRN